MRAACVLVVIALASFALTTTADPEATVPKEQEIAKLVRDLGAARFSVREAATRRLMELDAVLPAVRQTTLSPDADTARRACLVVETLEGRIRAKGLARILALGEHGELDRMIEGLLNLPCAADDVEYWSGALRAVWQMAERIRQKAAPSLKNLPFAVQTPDEFVRSWLKGAKYHKFDKPPEPDAPFRGLIRTPSWLCPKSGINSSFVLSDGPVESFVVASWSIVLVNGPLRIGPISRSIIVCDREPDFNSVTASSLVVVRGAVAKEQIGALHNCLIVSASKLEASPDQKTCVFVEAKSLPREVLHWFEPADVGLEVTAAEGGVRVSKVASDMPPAKAGIQKGDLITAVDGKAVDSEDTFRTLLRRGSVRVSCLFTIRRGDDRLQRFVEFWETLPKK